MWCAVKLNMWTPEDCNVLVLWKLVTDVTQGSTTLCLASRRRLLCPEAVIEEAFALSNETWTVLGNVPNSNASVAGDEDELAHVDDFSELGV